MDFDAKTRSQRGGPKLVAPQAIEVVTISRNDKKMVQTQVSMIQKSQVMSWSTFPNSISESTAGRIPRAVERLRHPRHSLDPGRLRKAQRLEDLGSGDHVEATNIG